MVKQKVAKDALVNMAIPALINAIGSFAEKSNIAPDDLVVTIHLMPYMHEHRGKIQDIVIQLANIHSEDAAIDPDTVTIYLQEWLDENVAPDEINVYDVVDGWLKKMA